jgi:hypothetical protein
MVTEIESSTTVPTPPAALTKRRLPTPPANTACQRRLPTPPVSLSKRRLSLSDFFECKSVTGWIYLRSEYLIIVGECPSTSIPGKPCERERLSTVDLLVLTSIIQLLLVMSTSITFYKISYINEEVNRTEPSLSVSVPCLVL